ncbi:Lipoxygenase [Cynara cardunculus var. scolymus]|uniref:Lipoxygenase n=1 Tax=Cynara cardunculus var. scolymus TaxID=59895 RepID=A0A103XHR6_CYNCS|nr:Lipoxygenase [Cynara cardunculus var. scolymus]
MVRLLCWRRPPIILCVVRMKQSYLPSETPAGLKYLREEDLLSLRGKDKKERKSFERIYDYDTYNDLGDPDSSSDLARPMLGGKEHPYPRRCRTGRAMTEKEPWSESRKRLHFYNQFYVPRDESFSDRKVVTFGTMEILFSVLEALKASLHIFSNANQQFLSITDSIELEFSFIESSIEKVLTYIFDKWADLNHLENVIKVVVPRFFRDLYGSVKTVAHIDGARRKDKISFSWFRDDEFCRQTLAGINPYSIQLVTALKQKKLFLLDYHDLLLPYVNEVRELKGTTLYGSRTLMFLTATGTLKPVAIELTRPPNKEKPQWRHVYIPSSNPKDVTIEAWLWKLAKAHVLAHDSGYHQLISHWLRTHCVTEPYIIATHRCLSKMHPIQRLLFPHLRYTMQINSLARLFLINAGGIIESTFFPGKYSMQLSSDVYAQQWRFDHEALPADLINRGMAVEDSSALHGIKLIIEDYPFANDGLILWDAIKQWATSYVNHYYPQADLVESDEELQAWWTEIRTVGHGDKKDEPWWPQLKTQQDLVGVVTTIMWVTSGHHSAVNFGQYTAAYSPPRPTIARTKMPNEDSTTEEWEKAFLKNPEHELGNCFPSKDQSKKVKSTLDVLSSHSPDEEYIGVNMEPAWETEPIINTAFEVFRGSLKNLEDTIDSRNSDPNLHNRIGKGSVPYQLLKPKSEAGVTGKGVPYSISI